MKPSLAYLLNFLEQVHLPDKGKLRRYTHPLAQLMHERDPAREREIP